LTFQSVRAIGLRIPGIVETTMYGGAALKLEGRMVACMATNKAAEPDTLIVRTTFDQRDLMIAEQPGTYYVKPHYQTSPVVLVRLPRVTRDAMKDLLAGAVGAVAAAADTKKRPAPPRSRADGPRRSPTRK
jgi:hypothetical protein